MVAAALKATNGALAQAGARLVPLAPAAWEAELRRHRMTLSVEVNGDDVARMHIERLPHEMEVAVGVREPQLIDLGRRRRVPVEGMTIHTLAELIASCAWPAIARFRETRRAGLSRAQRMHSLAYELLLAVAAAALSWCADRALCAGDDGLAPRWSPPTSAACTRCPCRWARGLAIVATVLVLWPLSQGDAEPAARRCCWRALPGSAPCPGSTTGARCRPPCASARRRSPSPCAWPRWRRRPRVLPVIPVAVERVLSGLAWLWFINLFNFMDGIDGLAGSEAIAVALGYLLLPTLPGSRPAVAAGADHCRVGGRLSLLELAPGEGVHGRRRLGAAGLPAGLADARPGAQRALGRGR